MKVVETRPREIVFVLWGHCQNLLDDPRMKPFSSFLMMGVFFSLFRAYLNSIHQTYMCNKVCIGIYSLNGYFYPSVQPCTYSTRVIIFTNSIENNLILHVPISNISVMSEQVYLVATSTKQGLMFLIKGHNAVTPVRLYPSVLSQTLYQ